MLYVQLLVAAAMAAVLLSAALSKAATRAQFANVLLELGISKRSAPATAVLVIIAELAVATALIARPGSPLTLLGVSALAIVFASAGALALRAEKKIHCGCFGAGLPGELGIRQIAIIPVSLALIMLLSLDAGAARTPVHPATTFTAVSLMLAIVRAVHALRLFRVARGDRKSAREMYAWLKH